MPEPTSEGGGEFESVSEASTLLWAREIEVDSEGGGDLDSICEGVLSGDGAARRARRSSSCSCMISAKDGGGPAGTFGCEHFMVLLFVDC